MTDDDLVERIAEAINREWLTDDCDDEECPCLETAMARAALAVARPAIRDETLNEVERALRVAVDEESEANRHGGAESIEHAIDYYVRSLRLDRKAVSDDWSLPIHRTEAGHPNCATCDGGGCHDCTDPV